MHIPGSGSLAWAPSQPLPLSSDRLLHTALRQMIPALSSKVAAASSLGLHRMGNCLLAATLMQLPRSSQASVRYWLVSARQHSRQQSPPRSPGARLTSSSGQRRC